ncbi:bacteriohemerythrin [Desulfovibrio ferrophilus]|uniref:Methyl-accepting chemotaxis sensory transducer n=1 Tax=Desulfovibrio ferrophilus TaxID=241368 RepID=A0A2Z6AUS2_9BACT|nr:bacteriohemerythrin [Desulfovibrio ferrophilus]BBD06984.1 methyl-accepting chemotaxis sensory transducer [Desulfovibrio ferrophilus]
MPVYWFDGLAVNVEKIDSQHKKLIDMINGLEKAIEMRRGTSQLTLLVDEMIGYARTHFNAEEGLMNRYGYPEFDSHVAEHEAFIDKTMSLAFAPDDDENRPVEVLKFLREWLVNHINGTDKPLGPFLNAQGVR